ncbi:helix-turn-helix transcriptional regulator [Streptomyces sp. NPDC086989]|uniref:helix-turn-helix transcriptional regulator n=1 Tax=Streptomyces sp. NPDC086989 TaxID=3365764 RepID=UPI0038253BB1
MTTVRIKLRWDSDDHEAPYDDVDLDALSPRARTLAEAVAAAPLQTAADIWMEHEKPLRDTDPNWRLWFTEEQASLPERRPWRGWALYPWDSTKDPAEYLEREARKIPPDWHVLGHVPDTPVPSLEAGVADQGMTRDMVLRYLREHGRPIAVSTWSAYVARGQAPKPARHVERTPLWDRADIDEFLNR